MFYAILADLTVFLHLLFIIFALLGALLVLYRRWVVFIHIPVMFWAALINVGGWVCPLTPLENFFLIKAGREGYEEGFIAHYLLPLIYIGEVTSAVKLTMLVTVLLVNAVIYGLVWRRMGSYGK